MPFRQTGEQNATDLTQQALRGAIVSYVLYGFILVLFCCIVDLNVSCSYKTLVPNSLDEHLLTFFTALFTVLHTYLTIYNQLQANDQIQ